MTLFNRFIICLLCFASTTGKAQNFYDEVHSAKFADYLFQSQQYDLAAQEYERLLYINTSDEFYKLQLFKSYRKSGNLQLATKRFDDIFRDSIFQTSEPLAQEYMHLLMLQNQFSQALQYNRSNKNITLDIKKQNQLQINLLAKNWKRADSIATLMTSPEPEYLSILTSSKQMKHRYPGLALGFSMVIPGSGKVYSGYWKDGLISLVFVAATGWQAYRGFNKNGTSSVSGWIWGGLSTGFYFGNLYGSFKSAKRFNQRQNEFLHKRAESYIYSTF